MTQVFDTGSPDVDSAAALRPKRMKPAPPVTLEDAPKVFSRIAGRARTVQNRIEMGMDTSFDVTDVWPMIQAVQLYNDLVRAFGAIIAKNKAQADEIKMLRAAAEKVTPAAPKSAAKPKRKGKIGAIVPLEGHDRGYRAPRPRRKRA